MPSASDVIRAALGPATAGLVLLAAPAWAQRSSEATYGRIDGDLAVVVGAGAVVAARGPRVEGEVRLRYLDSAGIFAAYEDGATVGSGSEPRRVVSAGFELRPLFLGRWLRGIETQRPRVDLLIDSFGIEIGLAFVQPAGDVLSSVPALQAGLGLEIPIFARATGPWIGIHGGMRWSARDQGIGGVPPDAAARSAFVVFTIAWHQIVDVHLVDIGDRLGP